MKRFIVKIIFFLSIVVISFIFILTKANGYTDPFYLRFTTPRQANLIIGTSRAAQGLLPEVFKDILNIDIYNYAFTIKQSSFGPVYYRSIKKKIDTETKNGIFIVTVDPWSISSITENPNDSLSFRELNLCLDNTNSVNNKPNFSYLIQNLRGKYISIIFPPLKTMFLHDDGWLEVSPDMDSTLVRKRSKSRIKGYKEISLPKSNFSNIRLQYLIKTISFLKNYGKVYLVRLPIHPQLMEVENELMPDFNYIIKDASDISDKYLDLTSLNNKFIYTDGNHLYKESGKEVSKIIANWIIEAN